MKQIHFSITLFALLFILFPASLLGQQQKLEEENQKLKESIKKVLQQNERLKKRYEDLYKRQVKLFRENLKLTYQNRQLAQTLKKLREEVEALKKGPSQPNPQPKITKAPKPKDQKPSGLRSFFNKLGKAFKKIFTPTPPQPTPRPTPRPTPDPDKPAKSRQERLARIFKDRAVEVFKRGQYDQAVRYLSAALGYTPKDASLLAMRGLAYTNLKNYDKAISDFTQALQIHQDGKLFYYRGFCYMTQGKYTEGISDFSRSIQEDSQNPLSYSYRGFCYIKLKQYDPALRDFLQANKLNPKDATNAYNVACIYAIKGDSAQALEWLKKSIYKGYQDFDKIKQDPDLKSLHNNPEFKKLLKKRWK